MGQLPPLPAWLQANRGTSLRVSVNGGVVSKQLLINEKYLARFLGHGEVNQEPLLFNFLFKGVLLLLSGKWA